MALDAPVAIIRYWIAMVIVTDSHELYSSYKVSDTYGDFEQTDMNCIAVIRYWIPMVILNRQT